MVLIVSASPASPAATTTPADINKGESSVSEVVVAPAMTLLAAVLAVVLRVALTCEALSTTRDIESLPSALVASAASTSI
mmetsp:Transcript_90489/g.180611  ORF Transcript_90489/g.180611 Transcript_90489/m.180611 type:complete len:80 (-) Transcript_90489:489-728(-)